MAMRTRNSYWRTTTLDNWIGTSGFQERFRKQNELVSPSSLYLAEQGYLNADKAAF